eukprot:Em0049g2a
MIRDRLVVGIRDDTISMKLQLEPDLTLKTAKKKIRQEEVVWEQQQSLKERDTVSIQVVNGDQGDQTSKIRGNQRPQGRQCTKDVEEKDTTASNVIHGGLAEVTGHKAVDSAYLDALTTKQNSSWMSAVLLNNKKVRFKLDIGAECGLSPAELSMGRRIRSNLPQMENLPIPKVRALTRLPEKSRVWITQGSEPLSGQVTSKAPAPSVSQDEVPNPQSTTIPYPPDHRIQTPIHPQTDCRAREMGHGHD